VFNQTLKTANGCEKSLCHKTNYKAREAADMRRAERGSGATSG
jgi:hypothetical protein